MNILLARITGIVLSDRDKYILSCDVDGKVNITKNPISASEIVAFGIFGIFQ